MTGAPPPSWPTSRVLARWRPHLERFRPRSLWLSHLLLHRVEAPVASRPAGHGRLTGVLLGALAAAPEAPLGRLAGSLHLDPQLLGRLLAELEAAGLARAS